MSFKAMQNWIELKIRRKPTACVTGKGISRLEGQWRELELATPAEGSSCLSLITSYSLLHYVIKQVNAI